MKKTTLWLAAVLISLSAALNAQTVLCNFDDVTAASVTNDSFGNGTVDVIDGATTPLASNATKYVKQTKTDQGWGWERTLVSFDNAIDLASDKIFAIDVYSEITTEVRLFLLQDDNNEGNGVFVISPVLEKNTWTTVYFDFSSADIAGKVFTKLQIAPAPGTGFNPSKDFFYDNIKLVSSIPGALYFAPATGTVDVETISTLTLSSTLELTTDGTAAIADYATVVELCEGTTSGGAAVAFSATSDNNGKKITITPTEALTGNTTFYFGIKADVAKYKGGSDFISAAGATFTTKNEIILVNLYDFEGANAADALKVRYDMNQTDNVATVSVVEDPKDTQNKVAKWTKSTSWGGWERVQLMLNKPLDIDKDGTNIISVDVLAAKEGQVKLKLTTDNTNGDNGTQKEVDVDYKTAGEWETLTFDLSGGLFDVNYDNIFLYFKGGTAEADTLYFDNVKAVGERDFNYGVDSFMIYDFETKGADMSGWDGSSKATKVENPYKEGINMSDSVGEYIPGNNWVGTGENIGHLLNFEGTPYMKMKVWSSQPIMVMIRAENDPDYGKNKEVKVQITADQTNKWTELFFNFEGVQFEHLNKVLVFFDPDGQYNGDGEIYYFDDLFATDKAPETEITLLPVDASTDVSVLSTLKIVSNLNIRMADDSEITNDNVASTVILKKTDANGADVAFTAKINDDKTEIMVKPTEMFEANTSYYFGLVDDAVEHAASNITVTGEQATFTTGAMFETVMYEDFDGNSMTSLVEAMGDPAGAINTTASNPADPSSLNFCANWEKGTSWGGWERIHIELEKAVDFSKGGVFSMNVYSPIETYVRFKVADRKEDGGMIFKELDADITKTNEWETLYFDFSKMSFGDTEMKHLFIYIAGGLAEAQTYYVDDVQGPALVESSDLDNHSAATLSIHPNPSNGIIVLEGVQDGELVKVYSLSGQLLKSLPLAAGQISISDLNSGMYFISADNKINKVIKK